jgi:hypothetical protein
MERSEAPITIWTREARSVVVASAKALGKGHYQIDFMDSAGNVLNVLRLSETALRGLAASVGELAGQLAAPADGVSSYQECCQ